MAMDCYGPRAEVCCRRRPACLSSLSGRFSTSESSTGWGNNGVFYGNRFGYETHWVKDFPFSLLKHPQYVGAVLSIWGFFIAMRFPRPDWYLLPCLETVYYFLGAYFEE